MKSMVTTTMIRATYHRNRRDVPLQNQEFRQQADDGDVAAPDQGQAHENLVDVAAVCSPGRMPGTKAPLFFRLSQFPWS